MFDMQMFCPNSKLEREFFLITNRPIGGENVRFRMICGPSFESKQCIFFFGMNLRMQKACAF